MTKQKILKELQRQYDYRCEQDKRGLEGAIDVAAGLFEAIDLIEHLSETCDTTALTETHSDIGYNQWCDKCGENIPYSYPKYCQGCGRKIVKINKPYKDKAAHHMSVDDKRML